MVRILVFLAAWVLASAIPPPVTAQYQVDMNALTVDEGLSQNMVVSMLTDSRGFLWIGTGDGLNRYDGFENRIFRRSLHDSTTIASNFISALAEAPDQTIIIGHASEHISIWNPRERQFRRYSDHVIQSAGGTTYVYHISTSETGEIFAIADSGVLHYNARDDRFERLPMPKALPNQRAVFTEADSTLLLFGFDRSVHRYHLQAGRVQALEDVVPNNFRPISDFISLGDNRYAMAHFNELHLYDAVTMQVYQTTTLPDNISAIAYHDSRIWISSGGLNTYLWHVEDPDHRPVRVSPAIHHGETLPRVSCITFSHDGIIWLGTIGFGITMMYDTSVWFGLLQSNPNSPNPLQSTSLRAIYPLNSHDILIGGYGGLEKVDFRTMQSTPLLGGQSGNSAHIPFAILPDQSRDSLIWIGTEGTGLIRFDLSNRSYQRFVLGDGIYVRNLVQGLQWITSTKLLLATASGLLIVDTLTLEEIVHPALVPYQNTSFDFLKKMPDGTLYAGTLDGTLIRFILSDDTFSLDEVVSGELGNVRLLDVTRDAGGDYWIGTSDGLIHMSADFKLIRSYTTEAGLPNNTIYSVQFDNLGYLWMSTNFGISRMDVFDRTFTNFTNRDGLQSNEFNRTSFANYQGQIMFFGGIQGLNFFSPDRIVSDQRAHQVFVEMLTAPSGSYRPASSGVITLPFTDSQVNISFSSPVFYNPRASESWYRFANIDTTWRRNPLQNELIFAGLQPGSYQLQLARASRTGLSQAPVSEVWFRIQRPFYMLWYVQLGAFLLVAGLVAFSVNSHLQKLRFTIDTSRRYSRQLMLFQDEERRRVAEALHDSIGSKLMLVKLTFRQVLMTVKDDFAEQKYQEINSLITDTVTEIREISQNIHPHLLEKLGVSKSIEALLESLQEMSPTEFSWTIESIDQYLTAEEALLFYRFVQESITNVLKHSKARHCRVLIAVNPEEGHFLTEIRDNGIGIQDVDWNQPAETMGLRSFQERAAHLQASFSIESPRGEGTIVRLVKPIPAR